jgi:hypothetical protein
MGIMHKKLFKNRPLSQLNQLNPEQPETIRMDPDERAASILERLDKLRKKVHGIRQDLEAIERDLLSNNQGRDNAKPKP